MIEDFEELAEHLGHEITCVLYGSPDGPQNVSLECVDCGVVLYEIDWVEKEEVQSSVGKHETLVCETCDWCGESDQIIPLKRIRNLASRLVSGRMVPYGACPECEALVFPVWRER